MKTNLFLLSLLSLSAVARADIPLPVESAADDSYLEIVSDPNIEPGRPVSLEMEKLYGLVSVPTQVVLHPKVLPGLGALQQWGDQAIAEAKAVHPEFVYTGAVITAQTWVRKLGPSEQKFWVFQVSYHKGLKDEPLEAATVVAHFVSGAYTFHEGKKTFKIEADPSDNFPFLGTFDPKPGEFSIPRATPNP